MRRLALATALCLVTALPLHAQEDTREARLAVAEAYVEATLEDMDMAAVVRTMYLPLVDQFRAQGMPITDAQVAELDALYQAQMAGPMAEIMRQQPETMANIMTLEEITALRDFYATPVGRSVMMRLPEILSAQQPQIMAMVEGRMPVIIPQVQQILGLN